MTLAIDAFNIALPHGTGVATYGRNLARAASGLGQQVQLVFGARTGRSKFPLLNEIGLAEAGPLADTKSFQIGDLLSLGAGLYGALWKRRARAIPLSGQVILPKALQVQNATYCNVHSLYRTAAGLFHVAGAFTNVQLPGAALAHWTYPMPIRARGACNVYTLHDLVPLKLPHTTADHKRRYYALCKRIVAQADHILTVSDCSRRDIIEMLGADPARVSNLYQSSDIADRLTGMTPDDVARQIEGLLPIGMRDYFLFFGAIEPKKNVARLLEAYLTSGSATPLVIIGAPGWGSQKDVALLKSLASLDDNRRIIWLTYLPRDLLALLIAGARAVLFPSLYEGFGLPVLEALSVGTPVMTSALSALPEVAGDAALLVNPYEVRDMSAAIRKLDQDADLRTSLGAQGREQAKQFSAPAYQARLQNFYQEIGL